MNQNQDTKARFFYKASANKISPGEMYIRSTTDNKEWLYMELQGELQSTVASVQTMGSTPDPLLRHLWGHPMGEYTEDGKDCTLRIGNLLLTGTKKPLPKPYIITERVFPTASSTTTSTTTIPSSLEIESTTSTDQSYLNVIGVVRHKVLFKERPQPIVTTLPGATAVDAK